MMLRVLLLGAVILGGCGCNKKKTDLAARVARGENVVRQPKPFRTPRPPAPRAQTHGFPRRSPRVGQGG